MMLTTDQLKQFIQELSSSLQAKSAENLQMGIYAFSHRYNEEDDSNIYPSYKLKIKSEEIKNYSSILLKSATAKAYKASEIKDFNYTNHKTIIDYIDLNNESIYSTKISNCINQITDAKLERFSDIKSQANCIVIHVKFDDQDIYLFAKGNPYIKSQKFLFFIDEEGKAKSIKYNVKLPMSISACVFNDDVYIFENLVESIFGFENSLKEQMNDALSEIQSADIFNEESYLALKELSSKGKGYYCYSNFDNSKLQSLKDNNSKAKKFLQKYDIKKDSQGHLILDSEEKQKIMKKFLCNDLKRDYINIDQVYDAPGNDVLD